MNNFKNWSAFRIYRVEAIDHGSKKGPTMDKIEIAILKAFVSKKDRITIDVVPMNSIIRRASRIRGRGVVVTARDVRQVLGYYDLRSSRMPKELRSRYGARCFTTTNKAYKEVLQYLEDLQVKATRNNCNQLTQQTSLSASKDQPTGHNQPKQSSQRQAQQTTPLMDLNKLTR